MAIITEKMLAREREVFTAFMNLGKVLGKIN